MNAVEMFINKCQITEVLDELSSHKTADQEALMMMRMTMSPNPSYNLFFLSSHYVLL